NGHAGQPEHFNVIVGLFSQRAHQYDNVTTFDAPEGVLLLVVYLKLGLARIGPDHLPDTPGNHRGLTLAGSYDPSLVWRLSSLVFVKYMELNNRFTVTYRLGWFADEGTH
ncbi:unnamed protein product, partial [marine sediment metagenome]